MKKIFLSLIILLFSLQFLVSQTSTSLLSQVKSNSISKDKSLSKEQSMDVNVISESEKISSQFDFIGNVQMAMSNPNYMVTAGDVYNLSFAAGTTPVTYPISVDSSYKIRVANLAIIDASGKTYLELKRQVEDIVIKNYPMSGVQFVLVSPAIFKVVIKGEVKKTIERQAWALTRLSSVVLDDLTEYSSIRKISITSSNGKTKEYDLFKSIRYGEMKEDPYLRPGDVITVNRADRKVVLQGSVERPEEYELLDNENLKELIEIYGNGLDLQADSSRIEVVRFADGTEKSGKRFYLSNTDIENNYPLENRDIVIVSSYEELKPVFFIEGAINISSNIEGTELETSARRPLRFEKGTNYAYFIRQNSDIFGSTSDLQNAYIIRKLEIIPIDLNKILYDSSYYSDLIIEPNDTLRIPFKQYFVSVAGSVKNPGRYPYIPDRTYEYYIGLAGGFVKSENTGESVSIIDINGNKVKKNEFITPESTITAKTNSFTYYFGIYAPVITTILTAISTTLSIIAVTAK